MRRGKGRGGGDGGRATEGDGDLGLGGAAHLCAHPQDLADAARRNPVHHQRAVGAGPGRGIAVGVLGVGGVGGLDVSAEDGEAPGGGHFVGAVVAVAVAVVVVVAEGEEAEQDEE